MTELVAELTAAGGAGHRGGLRRGRPSRAGSAAGRHPREHPLCGIVHSAGVLDDGTVPSITPERLDAVLRPKADAAWALHELTSGHDLAMFAVFSSAAGILAGHGQASYAAANAFLDALAAYRQGRGLPGVSLAWGQWADGMAAELDQAAQSRLARSGSVPLTEEDGTRLFDAALGMSDALLVPVRLETGGRQDFDEVPPVLRGLVRRPRARTAVPASPPLAQLSGAERQAALLDMIRAHAATVLGHSRPDTVRPGQPFTELGFDSLTSVELRNRLAQATGLELPATLTFDHPTPQALADQLASMLAPAQEAAADPDTALVAAIAAIPVSQLRAAGVLDLLRELAGLPAADTEDTEAGPDEIDFESLDAQRLIELAMDDADLER